MKVKFQITFDCEYDINVYDEDWMEEDDEGNLKWNEDYALELLHDQINDDPGEYAAEYSESVTVSELTVKSR